MKKIFGFYHICTINHWRQIVDAQIKTISESGLDNETEKIFVTVTGPEFDKVTLPPKYEIVYRSVDAGKFERIILNYMHSFCLSLAQSANIWYIHSKGVRHTDAHFSSIVRAWREYMEYFVLTKYRQCIEALENNHTCGVIIRGPTHYSGNFWWSRSDYIKTLNPLPLDNHDGNPSTWHLWYLSPEFWIGSSGDPSVKHHCLHDDGNWEFCYKIYPQEKYMTESAINRL